MESCKTCKFYYYNPPDKDTEWLGLCRRNPPPFPAIEPSNWSGEYKLSEEHYQARLGLNQVESPPSNKPKDFGDTADISYKDMPYI